MLEAFDYLWARAVAVSCGIGAGLLVDETWPAGLLAFGLSALTLHLMERRKE